MADDVQSLILQVKGKEDVENLKREIILEEQALLNLIDAHGRHDAATVASGAKLLGMTERLKDLEQVQRRTASATRGASQAAIEFSRGIEDLTTGGFLGVLNNIPRMFEGIGQAAGMSAAKIAGLSTGISLLATGAFAVYQNWDTVMKLFGGSTEKGLDAVEKLKKQIKELEAKDIKLGVDLAELDLAKQKLKELEAGQRAFEAAKEGKTAFEKEAGRQAADLFGEMGPEYAALQEKMTQQVTAEMAGRDPAHRKAVAEAERAKKLIASIEEDLKQPGADVATLEASLEIQQRRANQAGEDMNTAMQVLRSNAEKTIGGLKAKVEAGNVPAARAELVGRLRQAGAGRVAQEIEAATPGAIEAEEGDEAAFQRQLDERRNQIERRARNNRRIAEALTEQGKAEEVPALAANKKMIRERAGAAEQAKRQIGAENKREQEAVKASGVGLMAEQMLASLQAQGGANDKFGRFQKMDEGQIFDYVQRTVQQYLHRQLGVDRFGRAVHANAGMGREETSDLATRITAGSKQGLDKRVAMMSGQNLSNTGKLLGIASQLDGEVTRLQMASQAQGRQIDQLVNRGRARARTAQKRN